MDFLVALCFMEIIPIERGEPLNQKLFISWNVNGIRAAERKGFISVLKELNPHIMALQETKAMASQLSEELKNIEGYTSYFHSAEKKGYSGVAFYCKETPLKVTNGIGIEEFDLEGRVITAEYSDFFLVNTYFPNAGDGLKRLDYKLRFNEALTNYLNDLKKQKTTLLCGDYNVAHKPIDLKNPKRNEQNPGYTPEERAWMDSFIDGGFVDTFRMFNQEPDQYSWWSYRFRSREKNIGWRIDYFTIDAEHKSQVVNAEILQEVMGSDHCPVTLTFTPAK